MDNEYIAKKIKSARTERGMTQAQLAKFLNRTASNISDIETPRVQVSAADLYLISQALNKPIEYFYGEDFVENDIRDLIAITRRQPLEVRKETIKVIKSLLSMQQIGDLTTSTGKEPNMEDFVEFIKNFFFLRDYLDDMNAQLKIAGNQLAEIMKEKGIELPSGKK